MCWNILQQLALHRTTISPALEQLVSVVRGGNPIVIESAAETLYLITALPKRMQAAVDANALSCVAELLSSPNASVQRWLRAILEQLARNKITVSPVAAQLVSLVRGANPTVIESAAETLYLITTLPEGVQAAMDANVLNCVADLLSSPNESVRQWTCKMLRILERHETTTSPTVEHLVSLLRNPTVSESAAATLYWIVRSPKGAQAAVNANVLEWMAELLSSPNASVRGWPREILRELARHKTTVSPAAAQLVSLVRGRNPKVIESAAETLCLITRSPEGAQAAVDANVLSCMAELLALPNASVQKWPQEILRQLACHKTVSPAATHLVYSCVAEIPQ
ncbi:armadillo-type protein [Mycena capillaripes]|nr:armadillo-type protein [Mycena capillaripes]